MKREDIFAAIGMVDEKHLESCEDSMHPAAAGTKKGIKKIWMIAAILALMILLMGSAIAALVSMDVDDVKSHTQEGGFREGEKISFEKTQDVYIEMGSYYPQEIPEGYTTSFVSDDSFGTQTIIYENESGQYIRYIIELAGPASGVEVYDIVSKTEVDINGQTGILYEQVGDFHTMVWINEAQGFGFTLLTDDPAVDLAAMARSTAEGEPLIPTRAKEEERAIEELGDVDPAYLPEGFVEVDVSASPLPDDGWYSYVRKWYANKAENTQIYFEYETFRIITEDGYTDDAKTVCSFFIPGCNILEGVMAGEEVTICGMFGIAINNHIAWADPERNIVYHLYSEDIMGEALLRVAQSMVISE